MKRKITAAGIICLFLLALCGCGSDTDADISSYSQQQIMITGLEDEDFSVGIEELDALEAVDRSASASRSNGEKVTMDAVGPLLNTFLAQYGKSQSDFSRIRFSASDGYSIAVGSQVLKEREIVLAIRDGDKALVEDDQPLRVVIPGERAMYWVRHLCRIDFEQGGGEEACREIVFLAPAVAELTSYDYDYYGVTDQAVRAGDLLEKYCGTIDGSKTVALLAADGLRKNETAANFCGGYIKYTGADSPRFVSEDMPEGMQIYDLVSIGFGQLQIVAADKLISTAGRDDKISFFTMASELRGISAEEYRFTLTNGSSIRIKVDDLIDAYIYLDQGEICCEGISGSDVLQGILSIGAE